STIKLNGTELPINDKLTIVGPAAPLTLDANAKSRIFNTKGAPTSASIEISQLIIVNGEASGINNDLGGGINIGQQNVTLDHITISQCHAGFGGGGLANVYGGFVTIRDCQIVNNSAGRGGGLFSGGMTAIRTTIANNNAPILGGGIAGGS